MVEMIHCKIQTRQAEIPDNFTGRLQPFGHQLILLFGKGTQHVVNLSATRKVIAYAETQARILLRAQRSGNVLQPVVSAITAFSFQAQSAESQEICGRAGHSPLV